ncbi:MAG: DUF3857 domain-containing protein [Bacteroidetes bacterium]|nr:MAG: DUF3857 domain-containing protein [Bacteroidota bacterium]
MRLCKLKATFFVAGLLIAKFIFAQATNPIKFGKVLPKDFDLSAYNIDSSVAAVIISDVGETSFLGNAHGGFSIEFDRKVRLKILKTSGLSAATFKLPLYIGFESSDNEVIRGLKAHTYNLENGKVVDVALPRSDIFTEKQSKFWNEQKFTLPSVKVGSIIEVEYTIQSPHVFNLREWYFQSEEHQTLWSEYKIEVPEFYNYVILSQGYMPYTIETRDDSRKTYNVLFSEGTNATERNQITSGTIIKRYVVTNAPPLKEESFTSSPENHIKKIEFQLSEVRFPNQPVKPIMNTWFQAKEKLMERADFGVAINKGVGFADDDLKALTAGAKDVLEIARRIYYSVANNYSVTKRGGIYITDGNSLKNVYKTKSGTPSEINLLLLALFKEQNLTAYPILLSTRGRAKPHEYYPLMDRYNHVAIALQIDTTWHLLDASSSSGFGKLPVKCYNGQIRVLTPTTPGIMLSSNELKNTESTTAIVVVNEKGELEAGIRQRFGDVSSATQRDRIRTMGESDYFKSMVKRLEDGVAVTEKTVEGLSNLEEPLEVSMSVKQTTFTDDIVYFNPILIGQYKDNPFSAAKRQYPVEMPYVLNETYNLSMEIPEGYVVDEVPKSTRMNYGDGEGMFEYLISKTPTRIQMKTRLYFTKAVFDATEYEDLRNFFGDVVKKQGEQIVFKKKP